MKTKKEVVNFYNGTKLNVKQIKKVANNTFKVTFDDDSYVIKLHNTDILCVSKNRIVYNNGGWFTVTTKQRLNEFGPVRISQSKNIWYFSNGSEYYNNAVFSPEGKMLSEFKTSDLKNLKT